MMQLQDMQQHQDKAQYEADTANKDAHGLREDVSFLTKEQNRLQEELNIERDEKHFATDKLRKIEHDYSELLNSGNFKDETMRRELESLRSLREINAREITELNR